MPNSWLEVPWGNCHSKAKRWSQQILYKIIISILTICAKLNQNPQIKNIHVRNQKKKNIQTLEIQKKSFKLRKSRNSKEKKLPPSIISSDPTEIINGRGRRRGQNPKIYTPLHASKMREWSILLHRSPGNRASARRRRIRQCRVDQRLRHGFTASFLIPSCSNFTKWQKTQPSQKIQQNFLYKFANFWSRTEEILISRNQIAFQENRKNKARFKHVRLAEEEEESEFIRIQRETKRGKLGRNPKA